MIKKYTFLIFVIAFVGVISGEAGWAEAGFAKLGMILSPSHPTSKALSDFQQEVKKILGDQLTIQIFPDAQLGSAQQILEGLQFGNLEMGVLSVKLLTAPVPLLTAISMPYIFQNERHRFRVLDGPIGKLLLQKLEEVNLVGLGFLDTDVKHFITRDSPFTIPEAFKGQRIGLIHHCIEPECQDITLQLSLRSLETMAAVVELIPTENMDDALQAEELSGVEYTPLAGLESAMNSSGMTYFSLDAHLIVPDIIVASKHWFDSLSPQGQQALRKASATMVRQQRKLWAEAIQKTHAELQAQGVIFETVEHGRFRNANEAIYRQMSEQIGPDFENIIQAIINVR